MKHTSISITALACITYVAISAIVWLGLISHFWDNPNSSQKSIFPKNR